MIPQSVMNEFWKGMSDFFRSFWHNAAKQGFSIMLLIITNVGFVWWINNLNSDRKVEKSECKAEIAELRNEYRGDISRLRTVIDSLRLGLDDCNAARIRAEAQNAALMEIMKKKR